MSKVKIELTDNPFDLPPKPTKYLSPARPSMYRKNRTADLRIKTYRCLRQRGFGHGGFGHGGFGHGGFGHGGKA